jgi:hypothetical protein
MSLKGGFTKLLSFQGTSNPLKVGSSGHGSKSNPNSLSNPSYSHLGVALLSDFFPNPSRIPLGVGGDGRGGGSVGGLRLRFLVVVKSKPLLDS